MGLGSKKKCLTQSQKEANDLFEIGEFQNGRPYDRNYEFERSKKVVTVFVQSTPSSHSMATK